LTDECRTTYAIKDLQYRVKLATNTKQRFAAGVKNNFSVNDKGPHQVYSVFFEQKTPSTAVQSTAVVGQQWQHQ
jgi:hypothetical protein